MDKCRSNQNTGTEVFADEERPCWHLDPFNLLRDDWETGPKDGGCQNHDWLSVSNTIRRQVREADLHKAATWRPRSYSPTSSPLPHSGFPPMRSISETGTVTFSAIVRCFNVIFEFMCCVQGRESSRPHPEQESRKEKDHQRCRPRLRQERKGTKGNHGMAPSVLTMQEQRVGKGREEKGKRIKTNGRDEKKSSRGLITDGRAKKSKPRRYGYRSYFSL